MWAFFSLLKLFMLVAPFASKPREQLPLKWAVSSCEVPGAGIILTHFLCWPKAFDSPILVKFVFKAEMNNLAIMLWLLEDKFVDVCYCGCLFVRIYTENALRLRILCTLILCLPSFTCLRLLVVIVLTYSTVESNWSTLMAALQSDLLNFQKHLLQLQGVLLIIITLIETLVS